MSVETKLNQLRTQGEITYVQPLSKLLFLSLGVLVFVVAGMVMIGATVQRHGMPGSLANLGFWLGVVIVAFFGFGSIAVLSMGVRRQRLLVTQVGVHRQFRKEGHWHDLWAVRWTDITAVDWMSRPRGGGLTMLHLTDEAYAHLVGDSRWTKAIARIERPVAGHNAVAVEGSVSWRPKQISRLLAAAHEEFWRPAGPNHAGPNPASPHQG